MISRRSVVKGLAVSLGTPMVNRGRYSLFARSGAEYSARTVDLVRSSTVIDMLGLLTLDYRKLAGWRAAPGRFGPADYRRLRESGINVFHPAVGFTRGDIYQESLLDVAGWSAF